MATEYISREEKYQANKNEWEGVIGLYDGYTVFSDNIDMIDSVPVADVRPVMRGKWLSYSDPRFPDLMCYCLECSQTNEKLSNFCPSCGADMRKAQDG